MTKTMPERQGTESRSALHRTSGPSRAYPSMRSASFRTQVPRFNVRPPIAAFPRRNLKSNSAACRLRPNSTPAR